MLSSRFSWLLIVPWSFDGSLRGSRGSRGGFSGHSSTLRVLVVGSRGGFVSQS